MSTSSDREFLASAPRGCTDLLANELKALGATEVRERGLGVTFRGDLSVAYRACLESRVASRVFLPIAHLKAQSADDVYRALRSLPWGEHVDPDRTLACEWSGKHAAITHSGYGAQRVKDAIVDALRDQTGRRPDIDIERPAVRVHVHATRTDAFTVSLDLAGEGLHRRGYRGRAGEAPLRENVAAGILLRAGWSEVCAKGGAFLDPLCGSGTIVIEAAWIALDRAPGLSREYFGFLGWLGHDAAAWSRVRADALARVKPASSLDRRLRGADRDASMIRIARDNAMHAGVGEAVTFEVADLAVAAPGEAESGLLCTNPPYGVRLDDMEAAREVHRELGRILRERFVGWKAAVLTGAPELGLEMKLRAHRTHTFWNGAIEGRLLRFDIAADSERDFLPKKAPLVDPTLKDSPGAKMFGNRLAKNAKRFAAWAAKEGVSCYRVYDADMPEYSFAIDIYASADTAEKWAYFQEYAAPATVDADAARRRRGEALSVLPDVLGLPESQLRVRMRRRTTRGDQYTKEDEQGEFHVVEENGLRFRVNFTDYLDTGIFLDHRITRTRLRDAAERARFLNLFAYTGTATVYAAAGRARSTTTVDLSRTYLEWAQDNLVLNGFSGPQHTFEQADCREWLHDAARRNLRFDLIFLDPPTFSNSKRMQGVHDVQRDHAELIDACMELLAPNGMLVFSTNAQRFKLDVQVTERYVVKDIREATIPTDFERNPRIHYCFELSHLR